ncbi:MAG TPA: hypothetical protein VG101_19535 [Puia sp.]|jgi:hypothetical protein|nr:hypothetical protein [Puia sp.]
MKSKKKKKLTFRQAVEATDDISECFRNGLQGLGNHSGKIILGNTTQCSGSVNLDACTLQKYPQANRWDYIFCYKGEAFFVEVHSANTGEVSTVIRKLQWLRDWLNGSANEINSLKAKSSGPFYWVQSSGFHIPQNSPQFRLAAQSGIKPVALVKLP